MPVGLEAVLALMGEPVCIGMPDILLVADFAAELQRLFETY